MWHGAPADAPADAAGLTEYDAAHLLIKEERMPDGKIKLILKEKTSGRVVERVR